MPGNQAVVDRLPLTAIRERRSVTVTYPSHPVVDDFFEHLGGALPVADGTAFTVTRTLDDLLAVLEGRGTPDPRRTSPVSGARSGAG